MADESGSGVGRVLGIASGEGNLGVEEEGVEVVEYFIVGEQLDNELFFVSFGEGLELN